MASHRFLDHIGETTLQIRAGDLPTLFAEAAIAFGELERTGLVPLGRAASRHLAIEAGDLPALLVDWLNELIFLSETESAIPTAATVRLAGRTGLEADVTMAGLATQPALVKAATHHGLRLEADQTGWIAEVTLDV